MTTFAVFAFCVLLAALVAFQAALIAGAPLGHLAWGGQDRVLPPAKRRGSVVAVLLYAAFALVALERVGVIDVAPSSAQVAVTIVMWVITGYLALGVFLNLASRSRAERAVMTPAALLMAAAATIIALS